MGPIVAITFVAVLNATIAGGPAPGRSPQHAAPAAIVAAASAGTHDRFARAVSTPVVAYSVAPGPSGSANRAADETVDAFDDVATYAAFAPERVFSLAPSRHATLLARLRRAASRILAVAERMPHF